MIYEEPTPAEQTQRILNDCFVGGVQFNLANWQNAYKMVWNNPHGLTPAEVIALLGTRAAEVFQESYAMGEMLIRQGCQIVNAVPEGVTYTVNADGSITLTG